MNSSYKFNESKWKGSISLSRILTCKRKINCSIFLFLYDCSWRMEKWLTLSVIVCICECRTHSWRKSSAFVVWMWHGCGLLHFQHYNVPFDVKCAVVDGLCTLTNHTRKKHAHTTHIFYGSDSNWMEQMTIERWIFFHFPF